MLYYEDVCIGPAGVTSAGGDLAVALLFLDVPRRTRSPVSAVA